MHILAHRGASRDAPENTLPAFQEAVAQGADGVELDAMVCGSGEVVVCHDSELGRLARRPWSVATTPWWKLQQADVGTALGFAPARIPLLDEVLAALPAHMAVNIELKCEDVEDLGLAIKVAQLTRVHALEERALISSFNPLCLVRLAQVAPDLRRGYLVDPDKPFWIHARAIGPTVANFSIHPHESAVTVERVVGWHERGWKVAVWTVDDVERARELRACGVDYLITNRPGLMREHVGP